MWHNQPKYQSRKTPKHLSTKAGPVTVTRATGESSVVPAYSAKTLQDIVKVGEVRQKRWEKKNRKKKP